LDIPAGQSPFFSDPYHVYHLAAIIESSQDAIVSKDTNGIIKSWNAGAERLFGYKPEEIVGKSIRILIPPERQHEEDEILSRIQQGERVEHFETVRLCKDGALVDISVTVSPIKNAQGQIVGASKIARDIRDKKRAEEAKELQLQEIKHRVKNTLATVQALATQTFRSAVSSEHAAYGARLHSLSEAHDLLTQRNWNGARTTEIVERSIRPFDNEGTRISANGPDMELSPSKALALAMLLHELSTNAVKYGALSNAEGRVAIAWRIEGGDKHKMALTWKESGGPTVEPPARKGFGARMIERSLGAEGGGAQLRFEPSGLICDVEIAV
jgi:PAS domain S-box-containing protein